MRPSAEDPRDTIALDRRALAVLGGSFGAGMVVGLVQLVADADKTSTGADVATANAVHIGLALVTFAALALAYRRDRRRLRALLVWPFTGDGWSALRSALVAGPLLVAEVALLVIGRTEAIARAEQRWAEPRNGAAPSLDLAWSMAGAARRVVGRAPVRIVQFVAAVVTVFVPLRAGEQVFAALDPDFTRDAWGGPSYLGASFAHWLDAALIFYGCAAILRWIHRTSERRARPGPAVTAAG
jgi:hypothetical protein